MLYGEKPLYRVSVTGGTLSANVEQEDGSYKEVTGVVLDLPVRTEVVVTADPDVVGWVFDRWDGNFIEAGIPNITLTQNPLWFRMPTNDVEIILVRRELNKYTVYTTNATGPGTVYVGTYPIAGNLRDTEDYKYVFNHWICKDADGTNRISAITNPNSVETTIKIDYRNLWIEAVYDTYYKLTVVRGTDPGEGYYKSDAVISGIYADEPEEGMMFDHWDDPVGILSNIYDPTPTVTMKNSVATISAIYTSKDASGNSVIVTEEFIDDGVILRSDSYLVNGVYAVGAIAFDVEGCIGVVTETDPDKNDNTDDYSVQKLFYGGNF